MMVNEGLVGPAYGWRLPFLIVAVPALLLALLIVFTTVEPSRGGNTTPLTACSRTFRSLLLYM